MYVGGGHWHPERAWLEAWRSAVVAGRALDVLADPSFVQTFGKVGGDSLSRVPTGYPKDHPQADLLKLKDVTFGRRLSDDEVLSPDLPAILAGYLAAATPIFRLLGSV